MPAKLIRNGLAHDVEGRPKPKRGNPSLQKGCRSLNPLGRPRGARNKYTEALKDVITLSLDLSGRIFLWEFSQEKHEFKKLHPLLENESGDVVYLVWLSRKYPAAYAAMLGKTLPYTIAQKRTEDDFIMSTAEQIRAELEAQGIQIVDSTFP
jgi:hypothetical protein